MSRRPAYLKTSKSSYWLMFVFLAALAGLIFAYVRDFSLQHLVDDSELKGRTFKGRAEEIIAPKSGIKAYLMRENSNPLVSVSFIFDGRGSAYDEEKYEGLANLAAMTMTAGAGRRTAEVLRDDLALRGIKTGFSADRDSFSGYISLPKDKIDEAAGYLKDILFTPHFNRRYVDNAKAQVLKALATEKENPAQELNLAFNKEIYGSHPYGRNPLGRAETVSGINRTDLQNFVKEKLGKNRLYIGIAGDISGDEAEKFVDAVFAGLSEKTFVPDLAQPVINWRRPVLKLNRENGQNMAMFAVQGTCRKCQDFYPLYLANYLFGGSGLNSRLNQQIREKEGLTYGGYSSLVLHDKSDLLAGGFSATKDKFAKAKILFKKEWQKTATDGFDKQDLQTAKDYLTASYNLRFTSIAGIAEMLAYMQKYDLGLDFLQNRNGYVEAVTLQQLNQAAKKYFTDTMLQAEIGVFEKGEK